MESQKYQLEEIYLSGLMLEFDLISVEPSKIIVSFMTIIDKVRLFELLKKLPQV